MLKTSFKYILIVMLLFLSCHSYAEEKKLASAYISEGIADFENGDYLEAILSFRFAEQLSPNPVTVYKYLGMSYADLSLCQQAAREFDKILIVDPSDPERKLIIEKIHEWENKNEYVPSMAKLAFYSIKYKNRIWEDPNNLLNYLGLTEIYKCSGRYEEAENFFRALIKDRPDNIVFRENLGEVLYLDKRYAELAAVYKKIIDEEPLNINANLGIDLILIQRYQDELKKYPNQSSLYLRIARLYRDMKRFEDALDLYDKYLESDNANVDVQRERAETKKIYDAVVGVAGSAGEN